MKEIQADFSVDIVTNQKIDIKTYLEKVKIIKNKKNVYLSEADDLYYQEKYKKNIDNFNSGSYFINIVIIYLRKKEPFQKRILTTRCTSK